MNNNNKFRSEAKELEKRYKTRLTTPWEKNNVIEFHNSQLFKNNIKLRNRYNVLEKRIKFIKETINQINNEKKELQKELQKALKNAETNLKKHNTALHFRKNIFNVPSPVVNTRKRVPTEILRERKRERDRKRLREMTPQQKERKRQQVKESRAKRTEEQKERSKKYQREWYLRNKERKRAKK